MNIIVTHISDIPIFFEMHMQKITKKYKNLHFNAKKYSCKKCIKTRSFCINTAKKVDIYAKLI